MNMTQTLITLAQLRRASRLRTASNVIRARSRLAYEYLKRATSTDDLLDMMGRLLLLEGAAGVPENTWAQNPLRGMKAAQAHFEGASVNPQFFSLKSVGMVRYLTRRAHGYLGRSGVSEIDGDDIIQDGLAGLGAYEISDSGEIQRKKIKNKFWEAGKFLSEGIKSGKESPGKVAAGALGKNLDKAALNVVSKLRRHQEKQGPSINIGPHQEGDEGGHGGVADPNAVSRAVFDMIFFSDDPLGKAARAAIRQAIETKVKDTARPTMMAWWRALEEKGEVLSSEALAQAAGYLDDPNVRKNTVLVKVKKHWMEGMPVIFRELQKNRRLQQAISLRLEAQGVSVEEISWDDILKDEKTFGRFRKYGSYQAGLILGEVRVLARQHPKLRRHLVPLIRRAMLYIG